MGLERGARPPAEQTVRQPRRRSAMGVENRADLLTQKGGWRKWGCSHRLQPSRQPTISNLLPTTATPREYHKLGKNLRPKSTLPAGTRQKQDLKVVFCPASTEPWLGLSAAPQVFVLCYYPEVTSWGQRSGHALD